MGSAAPLLAMAAAGLAAAAPAHATWTIVAVDPVTREVGSAGASCTPFVAGVARLVPGRGAVVAQAQSNMAAKARASERIAAGVAPAAVIAEIANPAFDSTFAGQQYGIASLVRGGGDSAAFTGEQTPAARGHRLGPGFAVQGNVLASEAVLDATARAFTAAAGKPLADRLLRALEAGSRAGGDARCGAKTAQSAYLGVARPGDPPAMPSLRVVVATEREDGRNPVALVRRRFDAAAGR